MASPLQTLRGRLLVAFLVPALLFFTLAGVGGYLLARRIVEDELGKSLARIAAGTASQLNGDLVLTIEPGDDKNETRVFKKTEKTLSELQTSQKLRRIFVVDVERKVRADIGGGLPVGAEMPDLARDKLELDRVLKGESAASQVLFIGSDGQTYKTGYAPLFSVTETGKVVGAVGVEGTAEFFGPLAQLSRAFLVLTVIGLLALGGIALVTASGLARPLQRLMSAALRIGSGDLSTQVAPERTVEIGTLARELEAMRQALESRDRQLKMMIAGVAHEVKNPIGGMELFSGLLKDELQSTTPSMKDAQSHVQRIQGELDYLKRIVDDFLSFAREQKVALGPLRAMQLLEQARDHMQGDADKKSVKLVLVADDGSIEADENLLTAALVNLVKNAIQASPQGGTVSLRGAAENGEYVVQVADQGPGIPQEAQAKIFEPFFTTREKGTGLGLPLARKIVQAHRGTLTLQSVPGDTRFAIRLPLRGTAPDAPCRESVDEAR
ncbi:MAG: ATP-binding protein [Myxococcaceae bacterium]